MTKPSAGSVVTATCPKCHARRAKVALVTTKETFYRCTSCGHTWNVAKETGRKSNAG